MKAGEQFRSVAFYIQLERKLRTMGIIKATCSKKLNREKIVNLGTQVVCVSD